MAVRALNFRSLVQWFEAWLRPSCHFLRQNTVLHIVSLKVCKWLQLIKKRGVTLQWTSIPSRRDLAIFLVASCYRNWFKLPLSGPTVAGMGYLPLPTCSIQAYKNT